MSTLAGSFDPDARGLPRGRGRLDPAEVRRAHRGRLLRAAISAFAEKGFAATSVAEITGRARVAKKVFYELFDDKEACFVDAVESGRHVLAPQIADAVSGGAEGGLEAVIRSAVRQYLQVCAAEPEFTRAWTLEFPGAGAQAMRVRNAYFDWLAETLAAGHAAFASPDARLALTRYLALIGGAHELLFRHVAAGRMTDLPELEDPIVDAILGGLGSGAR